MKRHARILTLKSHRLSHLGEPLVATDTVGWEKEVREIGAPGFYRQGSNGNITSNVCERPSTAARAR